ncbi:hypothetical protein KFE25_000602 [Diacronema lutheri]|uniref:Peroxisomal membrane protein MPV17 n=2 Tax=Diacronema lutheri TaxID=2081491 RepID=A0A8J6CDP0_DIALT|nr:hypothetical protein KFE25_000602 [Diacronema lutheri]
MRGGVRAAVVHAALLLALTPSPLLAAATARTTRARLGWPVYARSSVCARSRACALVEPVSVVHSLGTAFEGELAAYPLRVNAIVTGVTYLLGDAIAQTIEGARDHSESRAERRLCAKRLARSFTAGLLFLGPLTHFYYTFTASQDFAMAAKVLLDNTLFLALDNAAFLLSLTLLGGGAASTHAHGATAARAAAGLEGGDELAGELTDALSELWAMQLTGWKFLPLVAVLNYALVPSQWRPIFVDFMDVFYAALLSLQRYATHPAAVEALSTPAMPSRAGGSLTVADAQDPGEDQAAGDGLAAGDGVAARSCRDV